MKKGDLLLYLIIAVAFPTTVLLCLGVNLEVILAILENIRAHLPF